MSLEEKVREELARGADDVLEVAASLASKWPMPLGYDIAIIREFRAEIANGIRALKSNSSATSLPATEPNNG